MDKILWLDGHITQIYSEEAYKNQYEIITETSVEYHLNIGNSEFVWLAGYWMEIP